MLRLELFVNNDRVDLFKNESVRVVSSVQNIKDISATFNDFSQSFNVPASPRNNKIFSHWYNAWVDGFDARVRHTARIEISGLPFRDGTVRLEGAQMAKGKPVSYKMSFFGNLIELKDVIGGDYLSGLDLTNYNLGYTSDNIITGITTGYTTQDYIFPLISTERQWFYDSNVATTTFTDTLANIAWNGSGTDHGMNWTSFRPALKIMRIIEAIESKYSLTFSRDFLGGAMFDNLYLWLANADSEEALKEKTRLTDYDTIVVNQPSIGSFDNTTGAYSLTATGAPKIRNVIFQTDSSDGVAYTIQLLNGTQVLEEKTGAGNLKIDRDIPGGFAVGSVLYCRIVTTAAKTITLAKFEIDELSDDEVLNAQKTNINISGTFANVIDFIPKIKVMDFLLSLMRAYNLIIEPTSATAFTFETLDDWYAAGQIYDITAYVDRSTIQIKRPEIYKEIAFRFVEPETILAEEFNRQNNVAYGDLQTKLEDASGNPLDGEEFEIELDFEQMVYERLLDLDDDSETNIVYGLSLDRGLSEVTPEPHIFYAIQTDVSGNPISIVQDDGTKAQINTNAFMPSHVDSTGEYSTVFGSEINEHNGGVIENSLFKLYYEDYITDSFSAKRRVYNIEAKLPFWLISKLKLNDRLIIGTDRYIINQMTTEVNTGLVSFELLNDIYNLSSTDTALVDETPPDPTPEDPPAITGDSFSISATGGATRAGGCSQVANAVKYAGTVPPVLGTFIYNEIGLTTAYDGGDQYYKIAGGDVIRINASGIVTDKYTCP